MKRLDGLCSQSTGMSSAKLFLRNSLVLLSVFSALLFFTAAPYAFAATITVDATSSGTFSGSSGTIAHTTAGSDRILFVGIGSGGITNTDEITGVTYAGVSMTRIAVSSNSTSAGLTYLYYLVAPASGTNNIVISSSGASLWSVAAVTYNGASQTGVPDSFHIAATAGDVPALNNSTTVVGSNAWLVGVWTNSGCVGTASTGATLRKNVNNGTQLYDSNGTVGTGSQSMQGACTSGNAQFTSVMASFLPNTAVAATPTSILGLVRALWIY